MLQTIEVEIDPSGFIRPLEPLSFVLSGRAYLTLLPADAPRDANTQGAGAGSAARALELLATPRFAQRPSASPEEIAARIEGLRLDWEGR